MSEVAHRMIKKAIRCAAVSSNTQSATAAWNFATGMIELAYAESLISGAEHDQYRSELDRADRFGELPSA